MDLILVATTNFGFCTLIPLSSITDLLHNYYIYLHVITLMSLKMAASKNFIIQGQHIQLNSLGSLEKLKITTLSIEDKSFSEKNRSYNAQ